MAESNVLWSELYNIDELFNTLEMKSAWNEQWRENIAIPERFSGFFRTTTAG